MRKVITIFSLILTLFIGVVLAKAKLSYDATLSSPKTDQAIMEFKTEDAQITHIEPETSQLSFVNADLTSTQLADFIPEQNILAAAAIVEPSPIPSPPEIVSTPKPSATPVPTTPPAKAKTPAPSPTTIPTAIITPQAVPPGSLSGDKIFDLVNNYRASKNLPALQKDQRSCELAASRAPEIMGEVRSGTMHKGLADRHLPYWDNENIAYYNTEEETVRWWVSDYIHRKQIEGNFKYSCVVCYKNACAEELTNFSPK